MCMQFKMHYELPCLVPHTKNQTKLTGYIVDSLPQRAAGKMTVVFM